MKQNFLLAAGAALLLACAAPALASSPASPVDTHAAAQSAPVQVAQWDRDRHRSRDRDRDRSRNRAHRRDRNPHAFRERYPRAHAGRPHWSRGDRLYRDYRGPRYYVNDYHRYNLRRPPRGYRWVRVNNDFMLVAITTGIIMDVILMNERNRHR